MKKKAAKENKFDRVLFSAFIALSFLTLSLDVSPTNYGEGIYGEGIYSGTGEIVCNVDAKACTISVAGGTVTTCSQQELQYQYDSDIALRNTVTNLSPNTTYNIQIVNETTQTTTNKTVTSTSTGTLSFTT